MDRAAPYLSSDGSAMSADMLEGDSLWTVSIGSGDDEAQCSVADLQEVLNDSHMLPFTVTAEQFNLKQLLQRATAWRDGARKTMTTTRTALQHFGGLVIARILLASLAMALSASHDDDAQVREAAEHHKVAILNALGVYDEEEELEDEDMEGEEGASHVHIASRAQASKMSVLGIGKRKRQAAKAAEDTAHGDTDASEGRSGLKLGWQPKKPPHKPFSAKGPLLRTIVLECMKQWTAVAVALLQMPLLKRSLRDIWGSLDADASASTDPNHGLLWLRRLSPSGISAAEKVLASQWRRSSEQLQQSTKDLRDRLGSAFSLPIAFSESSSLLRYLRMCHWLKDAAHYLWQLSNARVAALTCFVMASETSVSFGKRERRRQALLSGLLQCFKHTAGSEDSGESYALPVLQWPSSK